MSQWPMVSWRGGLIMKQVDLDSLVPRPISLYGGLRA
jgi:hypothetical protein